ncbi:ImmA/IrrE family metallo-endopeptidase [Streptococcus suis]|uniref:ImmA/IrrE family metallo-endopeptidase n=1 Tax=Streptococcus suis TaxID=1307 RepID=UPI0007698191|nr:ImmA/IrrE family metallo-endopeptidase [Streptococcus suis]CYV26298.1 Zn peptidase [Streptococcus suis]
MENRVMVYRDIYSNEFLTKFKGYRTKVEELELKNSEIDVEAIAKACDIKVRFDFVEHSGLSRNNGDNTEREIVINQLEPRYRQRFTMAHEIGHIILDHMGISYRTDDLKQYSDTISRMNEVAANNFAAELIMPKNLVFSVLKSAISDLGYSIDQEFDEFDIAKITESVAKNLNVSRQALSYRLENLKVFIDD